MTERAIDREPSISSSVTEAETFDDNEKNRSSTDGGFVNLKSPEEMEIGDDVERAELLPEEHEKPPPAKQPETSMRSSVIWMVVNTLATIGIVSLDTVCAAWDDD
jgi:solute carrier family 35 protein E3